MRSDAIQAKKEEEDAEADGGETPRDAERWEHDKFGEMDRSKQDRDAASFGAHWSKIKSEKEKEEARQKSPHRKKRRRRGKFSRSSSRSSGSSSSSSSSSSGSRSRSGSRSSSRSRTSSGGSRDRSRSRSRGSSSRGRSSPPRKNLTREKSSDVPVVVGPSEGGEGGSGGGGGEKEGVNLGLSGALATETNTFNGTVVKYSEPPEARKPRKKWRLYVFKGSEELPILYIHRQSAYLLGRDRKVADVPLDHPSCSKQHAVLQYRLVAYTREDGSTGRKVQLYVIDLNSANGTFVNNSRIEPQKYVQVLEKDVLKFGFSSREYVLLHDQSKEDEEDLGVD